MDKKELFEELNKLTLPEMILIDWLISGDDWNGDLPKGEDEPPPWREQNNQDSFLA